MTSLFLFGAGASFGSGPCSPATPPLGSGLFAELQAAGGVASRVGNELSSVFEADFEAGMDRFWDDHQIYTTEFLRDMASYFAKFKPLGGNLYAQLARELKTSGKRFVLSTTNYDLLIERAVELAGLEAKYNMERSQTSIPVLKLHGSCNFLPNLRPQQISGISFHVGDTKNASILETGVHPTFDTETILDFCKREDSVAPGLAMYSPAKQVLFCKGFVQGQQWLWQRALRAAVQIFVVGLKVHPVDSHIWKPLAQSTGALYYVGREPADFERWCANCERRNARPLAESFEGALGEMCALHRGAR